MRGCVTRFPEVSTQRRRLRSASETMAPEAEVQEGEGQQLPTQPIPPDPVTSAPPLDDDAPGSSRVWRCPPESFASQARNLDSLCESCLHGAFVSEFGFVRVYVCKASPE